MGKFARRRFVVALGATVLASPVICTPQSRAAVPRIGWISPGTPRTHGHYLKAFEQGLADHGYEVGKTILIEERWARGKLDAVPGLARELVAKNVLAIVVGSTPVVLRVKTVTDRIPIVHATGINPVTAGLAVSLAKPGGRVTGITTMSDTLIPKIVELMIEALPSAKRICVVHNPNNTNDPFFVEQVRQSASSRWNISDVAIRARDNLPKLSEFLVDTGSDAALVLPDPILLTLRREIVKRLNEARIPAMFGFSEFVRVGGLMSYGVFLPGNYRRAADFVDRILRGSAPGKLPVEQPTEFELVVNLRTAEALGLSIPQTILLRANDIIH